MLKKRIIILIFLKIFIQEEIMIRRLWSFHQKSAKDRHAKSQ